MASISYQLQTQMYESKAYFTDSGEWFSAIALEIAVDLADSFSKRHLPPEEYFEVLLEAFKSNLETSKGEGDEGWLEAIYLVETKQTSYLRSLH